MLITNLTSSKELSHAIKPFFSDYNLKPYNFHDSENSPYWLAPVKNDPTHKYAKLCFMFDEQDENILWAGMVVEKGVSEVCGEVFCKSKHSPHVMKPDWSWNRFLPELAGDSLPKTLKLIAIATGVKPQIIVSGHFYKGTDSKSVVSTQRPKDEIIYFEATGSDLTEVDYRPSPEQALVDVRGAETLSDLKQRLDSLEQSGYIWVDLFVGLPLKVEPEASNPVEPKDLAKNVLAHFEKWVDG